MNSNPGACLASWAEELKSRSARVRNLIGGAHWLSDGHHKEDIFREFLMRHLPPRLRVTRGFIRSSDAEEGVSKEIDAMVSDSEGELPWFAEGGLTIAPPTSVLAQIHVKTEFAPSELLDVLISGAHNQDIFERCVSNRRLWFGAVFFSSVASKSASQQRKVWGNVLRKAQRSGIIKSSLPDCVAIIDGPAFLFQHHGVVGDGVALQKEAELCLRGYECGGGSAAVFLAHLYDSISLTGKDLTRRGEWFKMISQVCGRPLFVEKL